MKILQNTCKGIGLLVIVALIIGVIGCAVYSLAIGFIDNFRPIAETVTTMVIMILSLYGAWNVMDHK